MNKPKSIHLSVKRWRDRINGNSYFSGRVYADGVEIARMPFQYGYGCHPGAEAFNAVADKLPLGDRWSYLGSACRENGIAFTCDDYSASKREVVAYGKPE